MTELKIVKVAVENTAFSFDTFFDYMSVSDITCKLEPGKRVLVPFGRSNMKKVAMIFEVRNGTRDEAEEKKLKNVTAVLDEAPILNSEGLELSKYIAKTTFCTLYEAVKAQIPTGMNLKISETYEKGRELNDEEFDALGDEEQRLVKHIFASIKPAERKKLFERFGYVNDKAIQGLIDSGIIKKSAAAFSKIGDKTVKTARLLEFDKRGVKLTEKQNSVLSLLEDVCEAAVRDILYFTGVTMSVVSSLEKKGVIELYDEEVLRVDDINLTKKEDTDSIELSKEQKIAYSGLKELIDLEKADAALLYGVTGSGKTQVFLKLIGDCVKKNKSAIVMVPEISLTPQTVKKFHHYFGSDVAVMHSGLSIGERYDQYKRIKNGDVKVVVGTRSAVFAPLDNIGIIVIDEEQESAYKSESAPRYNARDIAKFRCVNHNALLLLASATPSVESYYYGVSGRYKLFSIDKRFGKAELPEVTVVDTSERPLELRDTAFSKTLLDEINKNLENGEQSILLYNRRGYHTVAACADCKSVVTCPHCSIALTYHKANDRLMCHYCGYSTPLIDECPSCKSKRLFYKGQGTQRVEDEIEMLFPNAKVMRMDLDTTGGKLSHKKQFEAFEKGDYDILVGTQMVAKGLNFPKVTLVGVLNADQTLYANDFRSYERAFSLITQVVGRSGRGDKKGRAIIQSLTPQHEVISLAAQQDYKGFFENEIETRKAMLYPPFCDICVVVFSGLERSKVDSGSKQFVEMIKNKMQSENINIPIRVLGPSPMNVVKVSGKYRYRLIIKCKNDKKFRSFLSELLKEFLKDPKNKNVAAFADMNYIGSM
ncbi:MAG: primosomal protein N' [Oscillospiraceae bacterium]|nr:primosomal protein N' [Oscillospiraceae bacterium]